MATQTEFVSPPVTASCDAVAVTVSGAARQWMSPTGAYLNVSGTSSTSARSPIVQVVG